MNATLQDAYIRDSERAVSRWNATLSRHHVSERIELPSRRFNRRVGLYADARFDRHGNTVNEADWVQGQHEWLPSPDDEAYVRSLMQPVYEPGQVAGWIAPPAKGIDGRPLDFKYVVIA